MYSIEKAGKKIVHGSQQVNLEIKIVVKLIATIYVFFSILQSDFEKVNSHLQIT